MKINGRSIILSIYLVIIFFFFYDISNSFSIGVAFTIISYIILTVLEKKIIYTNPNQNEKVIEKYYIEDKKIERFYESKNIMSNIEYDFYLKLRSLEYKYTIHPQLNLATIIKKKDDRRYANELYRNIDFAIFEKGYKKLLLLIELNDSTHNKINRKDRDLKVKKICNDTNIPLMTFYTQYPNEKTYVLNRILKQIEKDNEKET